MNKEAEIRMVQLQAKECLESPRAVRDKEGFFLLAFGWNVAPLTS